MRILKKSVSILLALIMIVGAIGAAPFKVGAQTAAVTTWSELVSAVGSGSDVSIVLGADVMSGDSDSCLNIAEGKRIELDLNGFSLSRGAIKDAGTGYVFKIAWGAILRIVDSSGDDSGKISGGSSEQGGAFYNEGTLLLEGGTVCLNSSTRCGGAVYNQGRFEMSGGILRDNVSADGGAIYNRSGGFITLSGSAKITGNESCTYGGGAITNYGQLTVTDAAEISSNQAFTRGGGVWSGGSSTLELYGGTITGNNAGVAGNGVYFSGALLNMKGSPIVRFNDDDDLFLCDGKKIKVTGQLASSATHPGEYPNVGVVVAGGSRAITSGYALYNPEGDGSRVFFYTTDYRSLDLVDGEMYSEELKTTYLYRYWDSNAKKVRTNYQYADNVVDVATLADNSSVGMGSGRWYIVRGNVTIKHRLNINGTANLILGDGATLTCTDGIRSERGWDSVLNIYAQKEGSGKLISKTDSRDYAAIGGNKTHDAGTLNVYGGYIEAKGLRSGIAGGTDVDDPGGAGGPVKIFSGTVIAEATANSCAGAGIGGGNDAVACWKSGEGIVIYGGTVTATAHYGAGIGNGSGDAGSSPGSIAIYGGKVTAKGETGIGGGNDNSNPRIDIYDGEVVATGRFGRTAGAGIGSGFSANQGGAISIHGGSVLAVGSSGAGIGGGYHGSGGEVYITGGVVVANAACRGAGIGGGDSGKGGTVSISGGVVHASSTTYDRTGELYKDVEKFFGGFIKISPQKSIIDNYTNAAVMLLILSITAIVDYTRDNDVVGAGIGGGYDASGGTVSISGNAIVCAETGLSAATAIGKGKKGDNNGSLNISDEHMVLAGTSPDNLTRASKGSRVNLSRSKCVEIMSCDHQGASFRMNADEHLASCQWCGSHYWENHTYDSSGLICTVCGYERILVSFDANGGSGTMAPVYLTKNSDYNLPACGFAAPEGQVFIGWTRDGSEELMAPDTPIQADSCMTLTANWSDYLNLSVNGTPVSENNKDDILGDGTASFDSDSGELTLCGANLTKIEAERIALTVKGTGTIDNPYGCGIQVDYGLLTLDGDLDITGSDIGVKALGTGSTSGKIIIAGGSLRITGGARGISSQSGLFICNEIEQLEVSATADYGRAINAYNSFSGQFVIESELYIKEPENGRISDSGISGNPAHVIIEPKIVTVGFDANGADDTGDYAMEPVVGRQTNIITLPEPSFRTPDGKVFAGWDLDGQIYRPGDGYTLSEDVTFSAVWKNEICTLTFHANFGEDETFICTVPYGEEFIFPDSPFDYPDDMLLIRRWKEDPVSEAKLHRFGSITTVKDDMDYYGIYSSNHTHSLEAVEAVAPACEKSGNIAYWHCTLCERYYADEQASQRLSEDEITIPETGHTPGEPVREYEFPATAETDGSYDSVVYCTVCEKEISREQVIVPYDGHFYAHSLSLNGDVGVNFYLDLSAEELARGVRVDFACNGKTDSVTFNSESTAETRECVAGLYKATCYVCAAEMNDDITAGITVGGADDPIETETYRVRTYADVIIANEGDKFSAELITLVKTLLNYGAGAQTQFTHNIDNLANAGVNYPLVGLEADEISGIEGTVPSKDSIDSLLSGAGVSIEYYGYSLILKTKTTLRFYFKKNGADTSQLALMNRNGINVGTAENYNNSYCYIEVSDIAASRLSECYELKFGDTSLGSFSSLSYVKDVLLNDNGDQPITNTVTALYRYNEAAVTYFNSIAQGGGQ